MYIVRVACNMHEPKLTTWISAIHHQILLRDAATVHQAGQDRDWEWGAAKFLRLHVPSNGLSLPTSPRQHRLTTVLLQLTTIETYPQMIGYDPEVYEYFKDQLVSSIALSIHRY